MHLLKEPTIQQRFTLVLILVITAILSIISLIFIAVQKHAIEDDLAIQLEDAANLSRESLSSALWQYNYESVDDFVESLFLYNDIVYVQVNAGGKAVKVKTAVEYEGMTFDDFRASDRFISQSAAIRYQDFDIGIIHIVMSRERVHSVIAAITSVTLISMVLIIIAIFLTIFFLSRTHIFKPLAGLEASAKIIAQGDLDTPIEIGRRDEIGQLAATFKQMMDNLKNLTASRDDLDHEVGERVKAEEAMRKERDRAQTYLDIAGVMLVAIDKTQTVILINKKGCEIIGRTEDDIIGRNWFDNFIAPGETEDIRAVFNQMMSGNAVPLKYYETRVLTKNGPPRLMAWHNTILKDKNGKILGTLSSGEDITERRLAENRLKSSLEEKEVLLREIHHRVKNNLQMIQSLLSLQADKVQNPEFRQSLVESNNRIKSMALIHETLYRSKDIGKLDIENYFNSLIHHLIRAYHHPNVTVDLAFNIENLALDLDSSIACGLVVNELATNAYKYAFKDRAHGSIRIGLVHLNGENMAELSVSDNGVGLPEDVDTANTRTLGLKIVSMLAEDQLNGTLEVIRNGGTEFKIRFPMTTHRGTA